MSIHQQGASSRETPNWRGGGGGGELSPETTVMKSDQPSSKKATIAQAVSRREHI